MNCDQIKAWKSIKVIFMWLFLAISFPWRKIIQSNLRITSIYQSQPLILILTGRCKSLLAANWMSFLYDRRKNCYGKVKYKLSLRRYEWHQRPWIGQWLPKIGHHQRNGPNCWLNFIWFLNLYLEFKFYYDVLKIISGTTVQWRYLLENQWAEEKICYRSE